ncbi:AraC family transcriptional regulator [Myroides albus]|uniref:helix-turn-helix transcriptional regulator n=1 Tax=Myroides albus TaxID=2562892 RepID=UPI00215953CB|nr:AraC family transcriptional regulator [Myroides albus]UVD79055.1 AraC family transcriptional regulator [Myroides albus]
MNTTNITLTKQQIKAQGIKMDIAKLCSDDFYIKYGKYYAEKPFKHTVVSNKQSVLTCNCLIGNSTTLNHSNLDIAQRSSVLFVEQATDYQHIMHTNQNKEGVFIETSVSKDFFYALFEGEDHYLESLFNPTNARIHLPIDYNLVKSLNSLTTHPYQGKLAEHFTEAKIIDIHLQQYNNWLLWQNKSTPHLLEKDKQAIHYVRQYIEQYYEQDFTIRQLALMVGINQTKLKVGFKLLFDTTIFKYLHDFRMNIAAELIKENSLSVYQIAEKVGYKHSHHFSNAFKKHFGILPSQFK